MTKKRSRQMNCVIMSVRSGAFFPRPTRQIIYAAIIKGGYENVFKFASAKMYLLSLYERSEVNCSKKACCGYKQY